MRLVSTGLIVLNLACAPSLSAADPVHVDGREWRQLTDTVGFSWNQVNEICGAGVCSGSIDGVSFDEWRWATVYDVQALFEELIRPGTIEFPTVLPPSYYSERFSPDIAAVFDLFNATRTARVPDIPPPPPGEPWDFDIRIIQGITGTKFPPDLPGDRVFAPDMWDVFGENEYRATEIDIAGLLGRFETNSSESYVGVWLYRAVPEPGSLALLGLGLAGLRLTRRRKAI